MAAVSALTVIFAMTACGNAVTTEVDGRVGLQKSSGGNVVVLVDTCKLSVDQLDISGGREGLAPNETNPRLGAFKAASPQSGNLTLQLPTPASPWSAVQPLALPEQSTATIIVSAFDSNSDTATSSASSTKAQLDKLVADQVVTADGEVVSVAHFHASACR